MWYWLLLFYQVFLPNLLYFACHWIADLYSVSLAVFFWRYSGADASVHLMILHATRGYCPPFQVLDYAANVYDSNMDSASRVLDWNNQNADANNGSGPTARATVKVRTVNVSD